MFFNHQGRPDPNGRFQLTSDGKLVLRDGVGVGSEGIFMTDAAPAEASSETLTQAERDYVVARAKAKHAIAQAHRRPDDRQPFTAEQESSAIAQATAQKKATGQNQGSVASSAEAEKLRQQAEGARAAVQHLTSNAWRR